MLSVSQRPPTSADIDQVWMTWYKSMKQDFGKKKAKEAFAYIWQIRGGKIANTNTLRDYMETQGVDVKTEGLLPGIREFGDDIFDKIGSMLHMGKMTIYVIGGVLIVSMASMVLQLSMKPFKTLKEIGEISNKNVESGSKALNKMPVK